MFDENKRMKDGTNDRATLAPQIKKCSLVGSETIVNIVESEKT